MPERIRLNQLIDKTIEIKTPTTFYRAYDVQFVPNAKPVSNKLPPGYKINVDSYLLSTPGYTDPIYGFKYVARKDDYLLFRGNDKGYYAVKNKDLVLDKTVLKQQGIKTVKEEMREEAQAKLSTLDKLARFGKYLVIGIAGVWAAGYLYKSTRK